MIVDTHMHLYDNKFEDIREEVIAEALQLNIKKMIVVGCDFESSKKAIELANKYDFIYAAIGLHPSEVHKECDIDLTWIYELAKYKKIVAIGEIGLDYYWDKTYVELQKQMFIKQIEIAKKLNLPIIVHSRDSINDTYIILKENICHGVLHCYSGSLEMAKEFTKLGYYLGIGGVVTFNNAKEIKRVVSEIDIKYLLTETDAPYLAPVPFRGKVNKSSYIPYIIDKIYEIKSQNTDLDIVNNNLIDRLQIENILYENAHKLFKLEETK